MLNVVSSETRTTEIIAGSTCVEGSIETPHNVRVEGMVEGDIIANGRVTVDATARVGGGIRARVADVNGTVEGNINVPMGKLTLRPSAVVKNGVTASQLIVLEGAFLQGKCTTTRDLDGPMATAEGHQDPFISSACMVG